MWAVIEVLTKFQGPNFGRARRKIKHSGWKLISGKMQKPFNNNRIHVEL